MNKLKIDTVAIETLKSLGIQADQTGSVLIVMEALYLKDYNLLDALDDSNSNKNALTIYKEMERIGLLKPAKKSKYLYELTELSVELYEIFSESTIVKVETIEDWISQYRELWIDPLTGGFYKTPDKRSLGASIKDLTLKMKAFVEIYKDSFQGMPDNSSVKEIILQATTNYIEEFKKVRFAYCKDAYNFIFKQEGKTKDTVRSLLATACENLITLKTTTVIQPETYKRNKSIN